MSHRNEPLTLLGDLTPEEFLKSYWQQKPLLIRGAIPDFVSPLDPDELAGLACEPGVEARLVEENGPDGPWQVSHGPFDDATFERLPQGHWSLLVQAVDHYVPDVAALMKSFSFLPNWRLDDIMVSYAPPGGSVGPHVDQYDVFLLQGRGHRRWQLGGKQADDAPILQGIDLKILATFEIEPDSDWTLAPGDMLYLPPGWAHHGVSQTDDCMTYSIGFRAPSADEAITSFADYLGEQLPGSTRYSDAGMAPAEATGELDDDALERMRHFILSTLDQPRELAQWFGRVMTQPKYMDQVIPLEEPMSEEDLVAQLHAGEPLFHTPGSRVAWRTEQGATTLFVDGDGLPCDPALARRIADSAPMYADVLELDGAAAMLTHLVNAGSLGFLEDEDE
ncbi:MULTISPECIES: cupin domain-containing protein [unclassified Halomonas]|uniref:cupin domain-containing protein n=1 Tax=unclassified Halomonas TaxID=2609666 RepID=UPI0020A0AAA6|nr:MULTISPECIES: cupin domain-containing protein [unclassified Halomonas]MCP1313602.1 cupin domain-containing protein [Halomonas sp. 707D7]MCP1325590.1 cupin domain-containing protein [Halomonas sp. 707D4]